MEAGKRLAFQGSSSLEETSAASYVWDFGDNTKAYSKTSIHSYFRSGFYNLTLTVIDSKGKAVTDKTAVYVYPVDLVVDIALLPSKEKYGYGDFLTGVDVNVSYPDNRPVGSLKLQGELSAKRSVGLSLQQVRPGAYHSDAKYPILKEDGIFLDAYVNATDQYENRGAGFIRVMLASNDPGFEVALDKPASTMFSPGQTMLLEARFLNSEGRTAEDANLTLYEGWSKKSLQFTRDGGVYRLEYRLPKDVRSTPHLFIYGSVVDGSVERVAYKEIVLAAVRNLSVGLAYPPACQNSAGENKIKFNITYANGDPFTGASISAVIGGRSVLLKEKGGLFEGDYTLGNDEKTLKVLVRDDFGNTGLAEFPAFCQGKLNGYDYLTFVLMIVLLIVACFVVRFAGSRYFRAKSKHGLRAQYEAVTGNIRALKDTLEAMKKEYYLRRISEYDMRQRSLDYEKEIALEKSKLRMVLERMGLSRKDVFGREDFIIWLVEQFENGEDEFVLKKALSEAGMDPAIADKVKAAFT